jgi:NADH-quinone oxidoreductase subunit J
MMDFTTIVFYVFAALAIFAAVRVVTASNPVHAVLFLVLAFFNVAGLWLLLQAEFLAIALIMVYVGAVMVLFLFVVTMLTSDDARVGGRDRLRWQWGAGFLLAVIFAGALSLALLQGTVARDACTFDPQGCLAAQVAKNGNTETFGLALFHAYSFPFEATSVLLVIAVLGAVVLGQRALRAGREAPVEQNGVAEREPEEASNAS